MYTSTTKSEDEMVNDKFERLYVMHRFHCDDLRYTLCNFITFANQSGCIVKRMPVEIIFSFYYHYYFGYLQRSRDVSDDVSFLLNNHYHYEEKNCGRF